MKTLHTIYNNFAKRNLARLLTIFIILFTLSIVHANATKVTDKVYTFGSSSTPTGWSVGSSNAHASGYLKLSANDYLEMTVEDIFAEGEILSSNTIKVEVSCGTFGTWSSPKSVLCSVELRTSNGEVLTTNNATFSNLSNSESTYRTAIEVNKPNDPAKIAYLRITFSNFNSTSSGTLRVKYVKLNYETSTAAPCTVTLMDDNTTLPQSTAGDAITLPSRASCTGYTFKGWTKSWTEEQEEWTTTAPTIISAGSYTPTADESLYPVYTKTEGGGTAYEKVTTLTEGVYVMVSEKTSGTYKYMPNTTSSGSNPTLGSGITMNSGKTSLTNEITEEMLWDLTTTGTANQYYLRPHGSTTIGLGCTSSTGANIRISTLYKDVKWTITTSSNYGWQFKSDATAAMYLAVYNDDNWRNYKDATTNQNGKFYLFKQTSSSTTSYISVPDCDPCNALQAPNVTAKNITTNSFTLSWNPVADATSYAVYNFTTDETAEITDLTYTFSGLTPNTAYEWEVEAISATCNGKGTTGTTTTLKTYTITWKNADGTVLETDENVPHGTTPTYNGATPTKTATAQYTYTFSDWSPTIYAADKDQIYTAQFDETTRQYTVTFNANGHGTAPDQQSIAYGTKATEPTAPTAFGYIFGGWYKEAECTNAWNFATDVVTGNITLYAQWTEKALTRYRTDCDACIPLDGDAEINGTYHFFPGETITLTVTPPADAVPYTYQWQKLVGSDWTDIAGATTTTYTKDETTIADAGRYRCVVSSEGYCDEIAEYNVKCLQLYVYYDNKSDVFNAPLKKVDGATATIDVELQNAGYTYYFKITDGCGNWYGFNGDIHSGWCTNVEMNADAYCGLKTTKFGTYVFNVNYSDLTKLTVSVLYPSAYQAADKVIYLDNNVLKWTNSNNAEGKNKIYYRIGRSNHNSKHAMTLVPGTANLYKVTTGEYDNFDVWHIANNGCHSDGNSIYKTNTGDDWAATQATAFETLPVTLAAVTVTPTTLRSVGGDENNNNCKFYNYDISEGMKTWKAKIEEPSHGTITVKYTHHDGTAVNDFTSGNRDLAHTCLLTITATPNVGYSLASLTVNDVPFTSGNVHTLTEDAVIKATFTINTHVLTWNVNGGNSLTGEYTQGSVDYGTPITPPADPTRAGHTFKGWIDQNGQTTVQTTMPDYNLTYTAQWQINQYTVTLNPNYPAGKTGTFTDKDGNTINGNIELIYDYNTASKTITDLYTSLTLDGYEFGGWYNANGSNPGEVSGSKCTVTDNITGNKTYYAKWTKLYNITLSENSTTKELDPQTSTSYTLPTELSVGTCDNDENELVGWSTVTIPTPGDKPTTNFYDLGETVTLTADQTTFYAVFATPGEGGEDIPLISFPGGVQSELLAIDGISASGLGSDYAAGNAPYQVKLDDTGDYILYTNTSGAKITKLYIKVKMIGGENTSKITVQTSDNNSDYKDICVWSIEGKQNTVNDIFLPVNSSSKYIRLYFTKGSNVGLGNLIFYTSSTSYSDYTTTCLSKHSITYDFNDGEGNCDNEKVTHGEDYTICDEEPTKAGYTFLHWANGENTYAPGTTIENVQADITLTATWQEREKYTLTFNDQGDTKEFQYIESLPVEMQESWADICSGPIQYVFDGWAKAPVNNGTTEYEKVDFSTFTMPAENTTLYAVYRYAEEGGEPVNGYVKVTEALADWSGDYVIVNETAKKAIGNAYNNNNNNTLTAIDVAIENDKVVSPSENVIWQIRKSGSWYTMYNATAEKYAYITQNKSEAAGLDNKSQNLSISFNNGIVKIYGETITRCFSYYSTNTEWRTYSIQTYSTGALYRLAEKTIRYTSSLICGSITAEDALVTSTKDQKVKVKVPITLESSTGATTINATSDNAAFDVTGLTDVEEGNHTIVIEYTPAEYNITETANITLSATNGATATFTVSGRSLPENFVIATKVGATWYALPANMNGATNPEGVVIDVDETTMTATAPNTTVYTLFPVATINGNSDRYKEYGERLRFAAVNNGNKGLWANDAKSSGTTINNDAAITAANSTAGAAYEWKITTTIVDGNWQYTLQTDQSNNQKYLRYWTAASGGAKWGTYASGNEKLYFLPVTTYTDLDLEVMEWGTNSMVIRAGEDLPQNVNITINGTTTPKTLQNINGSDLYKIDDVTLTSDDCGTIIIDNGSNARKIIRKPLLVSSNKSGSEYTTSPGRDICAECDIVILNGGKLIADEAKSTGSHVDFANIYVYPGGKLVLDGKSLGVKRQVYLRGGYSWINQTTYDLPEVYVNGDINFNGSGNIIYDYYIQNYKYYQFSLPYQVPLTKVTDEAGVDNFPVWVKHYNGALRAADANATSWEWYYGENFEAGIGYIIAAKPRQEGKVANRPLSIIRFPLGNSVISSAEADKSIATTAHGIDAYNAGTITANNVGWNFIGNPFMATWKGGIGHQQLMKSPDAEHWNGSYHWENNDVKYITVMSPEDGTDYAQYIAANTELKPFFPFYLQETAEGGAGTINFAAANRIQKAPAELYADEPREAFVQVEILTDRVEDQTGVFISDTYSDEIDFDDYEKIFGSSLEKSKLWFMHENMRMAFEAMTEASAAANIALGYRAPRLGKYTFAINEDVSALNEVVGVYLTDHELGVTDYNLLYNTYEFETKATNYNDQRFTIRIALRDDSNGVVTGVDNIGTMNDGIYKFIYQDKMYIYNDGIIYDATGKQVTNINK